MPHVPLLYVGPGIGLGTIIIVLLLIGLVLFSFGVILWIPLKRIGSGLRSGNVGAGRELLRGTARIGAWALLVLGAIAFIAWGAVDAVNGEQRLGRLSRALARCVHLVEDARSVLGSSTLRNIPDFYGLPPAGFQAVDRLEMDILGIGAFWDRDEDAWQVRLFDLRNDSLLWQWTVPRTGAGSEWRLNEVGRLFENSPPLHPYLLPDGSFVAKLDMTPNLFRMDRNGHVLWTDHDLVYHHATQVDAEGKLWTCASDLPLGPEGPTVGRVVRGLYGERIAYQDDHIVRIDPADGHIIYRKSVAGILVRNGLAGRLFSGNMNDPIHLNDVVPALRDGPCWRKGDLFLSLRDRSMVVQYRPGADSVVRVIDGPFLAQHDINIGPGTTISVFSNRQIFREQYSLSNRTHVPKERDLPVDDLDHSQVVVIDLADGHHWTIGDSLMAREHARSRTQGLHEILPDGSLYLELPSQRRYMVLRDDQVLLNKVFGTPMGGRVHVPAWVRILPDSLVREAGFTRAIGILPDVNGLDDEFAPDGAIGTVGRTPSGPPPLSVWLVVLFSSVLLAVGIMLLQRPFMRLIELTGRLVDALLDRRSGENIRSKILVRQATAESSALLGLVMLSLLVLALAAVPLVVLGGTERPWAYLDAPMHGWNLVALLLGTTLPFALASRFRTRTDYSPWSKLLHRVVLNGRHIGRFLFERERRALDRPIGVMPRQGPVIISGLARAGTTALTTMLARSPVFHSLSYANMPLLLAPNIWHRIYRPRSGAARERSHGDKVLFSYTSVEALEEYFFKVFLDDAYIQGDVLVEHTLSAEVAADYADYQRIIGRQHPERPVYLAKNNNLILRYASLRKRMPALRTVFLFREPIDHAWSLMKQHLRFTEMQRADPFVREYMDWLGHHEFGLGLKHFVFAGEHTRIDAAPDSIDHWLQVWIAYYARLLDLIAEDGTLLIAYADLLRDPDGVLLRIGEHVGMDLQLPRADPFANDNAFDGSVDKDLRARADALYTRLLQKSMTGSTHPRSS
ncbi:MAG: sulfotransferase [Flavobacteriales bacterium]|nr:sulfotransferase [Flavobacteriales bacterium]MCB9168647.1 sulfotransferase [Flavobacteriales bacterium]